MLEVMGRTQVVAQRDALWFRCHELERREHDVLTRHGTSRRVAFTGRGDGSQMR